MPKRLNKIQGRPFFVQEVVAAIRGQLGLASANGSKPTPALAVAGLAGAKTPGGNDEIRMTNDRTEL